MYTSRPGLILGFHGTDASVVSKVVSQTQPLQFNNNPWDWLGHGAYFWEYSPSRALEYAQTAAKRKGSSITEPAVLGAVLELGNCLDLMDYHNLSLLKMGYQALLHGAEVSTFEPPQNRPAATGDANDLLMRELDCAVIEIVHDMFREHNHRPFDSVKGVFWEGDLIYPDAGFREKNHIQICVRNPNCIKGFFIPRNLSDFKG